MAVYNINTTTGQDTILAKVLVAVNIERVGRGLPAIGLPQLVNQFFIDNIAGHKRNQDDVSSLTLFTAYDIATTVQQNNIKIILGIV